MAKHPRVPEGKDASYVFSGSDSKKRLEERKKRATAQATKASKRRSAAKKRETLQGKPGHPLAVLIAEAQDGNRRAISRIKDMFGCNLRTLETRAEKCWPRGIGIVR